MASITHLYPQGFNPKHFEIERQIASPIDDFRKALHEAGLIAESINPNGKINRIATREDKGTKKTGWYIFFSDSELSAGAFGDWRSGMQSTWCSKSYESLTIEQQRAHQQRMEQIKKIREKERAAQYEKAQKNANEIWSSAQLADDNHPYLQAKGVGRHGLKQLSDGRLVVPVINGDGEIQSLQFIDQEGDKKFLTGGKVVGGFVSIGKLSPVIYICEGYSTAASIFEATKNQTIAAFNSGNLKAVAEIIRAQNPDARVIIAADNDQFNEVNVGVEKATEAAQAANASVVIPEFADTSTKPTDFNDLFTLAGPSELKRQLGHHDPLSVPMSSMAGREVKEVEWVLEGVLSKGAPAILFATGGAGKSLFIQHLASCIATGRPFFGKKVMRGPVLSIYCEDDLDEMHRRQTAICDVHKIPYSQLDQLHMVSRVGQPNNFLITFDAKNVGTATDFYHQIDLEMERIKPVFMTFDTSGDAFPGNENDKAQVNQLLKGMIGALAEKHDCAILLTGHTPKSGAEFAGHMAWENSVRHRIFIDHDRDTGVRKVRLSKTNRGKEGDLFTLYWSRGCLAEMVDSSFVEGERIELIKKQTLQLIQIFNERKTNINLSKNGNYAPKELANLGKRKRINWNQEKYEEAIEILLDENRIELAKGHSKTHQTQTLKLTNCDENKPFLKVKK